MSPRDFKLCTKIQRTFQTVGLLSLALLFVEGCAFKKVPTQPTEMTAASPKTNKIEPEARTLFFQAERMYFQKNFPESSRLYSQVKAKFPRTRAAQISSYRLGSIHYYQGNYSLAEVEFDSFLSRYPQSELTFDVVYNLAATRYQREKYQEAASTLSRLKFADIQTQGSKRAEVVYQLGAQIASSMGNHSGAVLSYSFQLQLAQTEGARRNIEENITSELNAMNDPSALERLMNEVTEPSTKSKIAARLAVARTPEPAVVQAPLPASSVSEISALPLGRSSSGEKSAIGIVLPLTGKFAAYGKKALDGILIASRSFSPDPAGFHLIIEDTASSPVLAQAAVERLVRSGDVMAIIGPLNWKESVAAAEKAQELGVLNLSLNAKEGIAQKGAYLFQNALTPRVQLESLVDYAVRERGLKRFAIFAPANNFGKDMAKEFWDAVERAGGQIMAYETYPPEEKDFQSYVQSAVGVSQAKYRTIEWKKLTEWAEEEKKRTRKSFKMKLAPLIDFDAVFIPDAPRSVGSLAASLAFFDVTGLPLLGTTEWNSPELYRRGGKYVEGSIFPGSISQATRNSTQREFIKRYTEAYGAAPDLLATQGFEAMQVVGVAIQKNGSNNRNEIVSELQQLKNFESPLGSLTFDETRVAKRRLPIYTLEAGGVVVEQ